LALLSPAPLLGLPQTRIIRRLALIMTEEPRGWPAPFF
jgi:hypothetical protein